MKASKPNQTLCEVFANEKHPNQLTPNTMKLYYYSDLNGHSGWFADAASFRKAFPQATLWIRTSHVGVPAPTGYVKLEGELAFAPAVMVRGRGRTYYRSLLTANTQVN